MAYRQSSPHFNYSTPLKSINTTPLLSLQPHPSTLTHRQPTCSISNYTQLQQLRLKCAKIDEIQKYANILIESIKKYKLQNEVLNNLIKRLTTEVQVLKDQNKSKNQNRLLSAQKPRKDEALSLHHLKLPQAHESSKRLQQQWHHQFQKKQKYLLNIQQKHKIEMTQLQGQLKINLNHLQKQRNSLLIENQSIFKQNNQLKHKLSQSDHHISKISQQIQRVTIQLQKYKDMLIRSEDQVNNCHHTLNNFKNQNMQIVSTLKAERDHLRRELEQCTTVRTILENMNTQLKSQGADLIYQANHIKERTLELEEHHCRDMRNIEVLHKEIETLTKTRSFLEDRVRDGDAALKSELFKMQQSYISLKKRAQQLQMDNNTKQKEIKDILVIVAKLQLDIKVTASTAMNLQKQNSTLQHQNKILEQQSQTIMSTHLPELQHHKTIIISLQAQIQQLKTTNLKLTTNLQDIQLKYSNERTMIKLLEQQIQGEKIRVTQLQLKYQRVMNEKMENDNLSNNWKVGLHQLQKLYTEEKNENMKSKQEILQLRSIQLSLTQSIGKIRQQNMVVSEQNQVLCDQIKSLRDSLENIDRRYELLLNSKKQEFVGQIVDLQRELQQLARRQ